MHEGRNAIRSSLRWIGLLGGPLVAAVVFGLIPDSDLALPGRVTLGLLIWMAVWWLTEAIDVSATALLPLAVLPLGTSGAFGSSGEAMRAAAAPYANPFIVLFFGGFVLALSMERWGLHKRIALIALRCVGVGPRRIIAGMMAISAVMSMWVSNTATVVLMLPIALSIADIDDGADATRAQANFRLCLMLGIAYAASVGGIGTLIGTPPNLILAGFLQETYEIEISFGRWMLVGVPLVAVFVPAIWFVLVRVVYPVHADASLARRAPIRDEQRALGGMNAGEWITFGVFMLTASCWMLRPVIAEGVTRVDATGQVEVVVPPLAPGLTDAGIAAIAALLLFVIPVRVRPKVECVMDWQTTRRVPWGVLVLFGGGLSLASAVTTHGVADYIGLQAAGLAGLPPWLIVVLVVAGVIMLTEMTSNTATTAALLPILASIAPTFGVEPLALLVPAAIAASCAFMMPVATPPNAIVFGSGHVTIPQMCRAGIWLNAIGVVLVVLLTYLIALPVLGVAST